MNSTQALVHLLDGITTPMELLVQLNWPLDQKHIDLAAKIIAVRDTHLSEP
jgi:hypothetical protein